MAGAPQVVTFGPHVNRAGSVVGRCVDHDVRVVQAPDDPLQPFGIRRPVRGWFATAVEIRCAAAC